MEFNSFYYYDTDSCDFVRIRLELGRTGNNPDPGVFPRLNRFVGFVDSTDRFDFKKYEFWSVNNNKEIVYSDKNVAIVLSNQPAVGKKVIDFSLSSGEDHPTFVHHGNPIVAGPFALPSNSKGEMVTTDMLQAIAEKNLGQDKTIKLCISTATPAQLGDAIFTLYQKG